MIRCRYSPHKIDRRGDGFHFRFREPGHIFAVGGEGLLGIMAKDDRIAPNRVVPRPAPAFCLHGEHLLARGLHVGRIALIHRHDDGADGGPADDGRLFRPFPQDFHGPPMGQKRVVTGAENINPLAT